MLVVTTQLSATHGVSRRKNLATRLILIGQAITYVLL